METVLALVWVEEALAVGSTEFFANADTFRVDSQKLLDFVIALLSDLLQELPFLKVGYEKYDPRHDKK